MNSYFFPQKTLLSRRRCDGIQLKTEQQEGVAERDRFRRKKPAGNGEPEVSGFRN